MVDKRGIKRQIDWLQQVKTWQLILILVVASLLTATFLRLNNIGMIERRAAVINADKEGDPETIRSRLFALQRYSSSHMNASSGTVYLEEQYRRDTEYAIRMAAGPSNSDNINANADRVCKAQHGGYSQAYVQCFASELAKVPEGSNAPDKANLPSASLYRHEFVSPLLSFDFAGLGVVICIAILIVLITRLVGLALLQVLLHRHYSEA